MRGESIRGVTIRVSMALLIGWVVAGLWLQSARPGYGDLEIYLGAWRHHHGGSSLYDYQHESGLGFTYPPFALWLMSPLLRLAEGHVWRWDVMLILAVSMGTLMLWAWLHRQSRSVGPRMVTPALAALLIVTLLSQPVRDSLHFGQISPLISLLALVGVAPMVNRSIGPIAVGLASAVKVTPAAVWAIWAGRADRGPGPVMLSVGTFAGITALTWMIAPGLSREYWTERLWHTDRVGDRASLGNNSLWGISERLGGGTPGALVACLVVLSLAVWWARRRGEDLPRTLMVGYLVSLAVAPITWTHHAALVVPVVSVMAISSRHARSLIPVAAVVTITWLSPVYFFARLLEDPYPAAASLLACLRMPLLMLFLIMWMRGDRRAGAGPGHADGGVPTETPPRA